MKKKSEETALVLSEKAQGQVLHSVEALFEAYEEKLSGIKKISDFAKGKDDLLLYFTVGDGRGYSTLMAEKVFEFAPAKATLDAEFWDKAIEMTDVLQCMPADDRNKWKKDIHDHKTPSFERETVIGTIRSLLLSRGAFIADKVDGVFRKLSDKHVTNSPMAFKERMIISGIVSQMGAKKYEHYHVSSNMVSYLHDLRSVIAKMNGRDESRHHNTYSDISRIVNAKAFGEWQTFDGGAFKIKVFKVGTAHLEVHPEIAVKLNGILASKYPQAIATGARKTSRKEKEIPLYKDLIPFEVCNVIADLARELGHRRWVTLYKAEELNKQNLDELTKVLTFLGGTESDGTWNFGYDASDVMIEIARTGCLPEKKSHQFYPTEKVLAERVVELADISDEDTILEPSAGHGGIAELLPKDRTTCVEVDRINTMVLEKKGYSVQEVDFLKWSPNTRFSKILMNPPFASGAAEMHVNHAAELLAGNGKLVAILPSSLRNKTVVEGMNHTWSEVIQDAFSDTGVSVAILELTHKECA